MRVYVANTTRQIQDFAWRALETNKLVRIPIEVGAQVMLPGDWQKEEIDHIVAQHARYGVISVDEIDRSKAFIGLCYSVDKPIPVEKIRRALVTNQAVLEERGRELRKHAAVAAAQQVQNDNPTAGLTRMEMTIQEEREDGGAPAVNEGIRVDASAAPPTAPQPQGRGGRRRAA